jgi:hypothetical protein
MDIFPILQRPNRHDLDPNDMYALVEEVAIVLQRCFIVDESTLRYLFIYFVYIRPRLV